MPEMTGERYENPQIGTHLKETVTSFLKSRLPAAREASANKLYDRLVPKLPQDIRAVATRLEKPFRLYAKISGITGFAQDIMFTTAAAGGTVLIGYELVKRFNIHREKQPDQPMLLITQTNNADVKVNAQKITQPIDPDRLRRRTHPKRDNLKPKTPFETGLRDPNNILIRSLRSLVAEPSQMLADNGRGRVRVALTTGDRLMTPQVQDKLDAMQAIRKIVEPDAIPPLLFQTLESSIKGLVPANQKAIFRQFFAKGDTLFEAWQSSGKGIREYFGALQQENRGGISRTLDYIRSTVMSTVSDPDAVNAIVRKAFGIDALNIGKQLLPSTDRVSPSPQLCLDAYLRQS